MNESIAFPLLTRTGSQTSLGFSVIVGVHAVIKHDLSLIGKYHGFLFLESLPETFALSQKSLREVTNRNHLYL